MLTFKNPHNGYKETVQDINKLWATLFGAAYFAYRGAWPAAFITFVVSFITFSLHPVIYLAACLAIGLNATRILEKHFLKSGWTLVKTKGKK